MIRAALALLLLAPATPPADPGGPPGGADPGFELVALGTSGGLEDGRLTAFLLRPAGSRSWIALDAGTLVAGIQRAVVRGTLSGSVEANLRSVCAVLLSHPHLDHVLGLVVASPDDSNRPIYGLPATIAALRDHLFNGLVWPNFADEGAEPRLSRYRYVRLAPGLPAPLDPTALTVEAHPLCHAGRDRSTAFLVGAGQNHLLYLGDTGSDEVESCDRLGRLWLRVAPLVARGQLLALVAEASYPDPRPDRLLFGHLTPSLLMDELRRLATASRPDQPRGALTGLTVVVTHVKPSLAHDRPRATILRQLQDAERREGLGVRFVMPADGDRIDLPAAR